MRVKTTQKSEPPLLSHAILVVNGQGDLSQVESFMKTWARGSTRLIFHGDDTMLTTTDPADIDRLLRFCGSGS
jgi:hypothetical protein